MGYLPETVRERTRRQRAIITRAELLELDATDRQIQLWLRSGCLERLHRGVYAVGGAVITSTALVDAALRRAGDGARAGGRSALGLCDLDGFHFRDEDEEEVHRPFLTLPKSGQLQGVDFDWVAVDLPDHVGTTYHGIPAVTVADGLVEAADHATRKQIRVGFDDAVRRDLVSGRELEQAARRLAGVLDGAEVVEKLIANGTLQLESEGERNLVSIFAPEDPQPVYQVKVGAFRVDALFVEARLALEYQGKRYHRSEQDRRADRARADKLAADHDIVIIEVTAADLANPVALRERILAARAERLRSGVAPLRAYSPATR